MAAAASCLVLLAAACSSSSSSPSASARPSVSSPPAGDPLAALTVNQIVAKVNADLGSAPSVHLTGEGAVGGQLMTINVTLAQRGCDWTLTYPGKGSVELILIGSSAWMKADTRFWDSEFGASRGPVIAQLLDGRYAKVPASKVGGMVSYCSPRELVKQMTNSDPVAEGPVSVIDGQRALEMRDTVNGSVAYVSESAHPELLRIDPGKGQGPGQLTMTYNGPGTISPPAAGQVVDFSGFAAPGSAGTL